jgi:pimeloyl-ACP methyl ester carboxylesterase
MTTFVLIHGAYHGGWCWSRVASRLRALGHTVHAPTLAGMGEHAHLLSRQITLDTHIDDVVSHIETEELGGVVLVGHSYGGLIITGAADRLDGTGRIARLVYLDALAPVDGSRWSDFNTPAAAEARHASAQKAGGLFMPPPDAAVFGLTDPADIAWANRRLRPHPYGCYLSTLRLPNLAAGRGAAALPRTYIDCTEPLYSDFNGLKARLKADPAWKYVEIRTGHNAMVSAPEELTTLLLA